MKTLNETFTDKEWKKLSETKGKTTWHDFIMKLVTDQKMEETK